MKLIFASHNAHKLHEIKSIMPSQIELVSLTDIGFHEDIPEPYDTFFENAETKADLIYKRTGENVFSEDSGLVVEALDGRPGVYSARYAGEHKNDEANLEKVLEELSGVQDRRAYYLSHICLVWNGEMHHFEGKCHGSIALKKQGSGGFGYDPVFIPEGYGQSFGELDMAVKMAMSHRSAAFKLMMAWLKNNVQGL